MFGEGEVNLQHVMDQLLKRIEFCGYSRRNFAEKIKVSRETFRRGLICEYEMDVAVFFNPLRFYLSIQLKKKIIREFFNMCESISNIEVALIYCQVQGEYNLMQHLITKHENKTNLGIFLVYINFLIRGIEMS